MWYGDCGKIGRKPILNLFLSLGMREPRASNESSKKENGEKNMSKCNYLKSVIARDSMERGGLVL